MILSEEEVRVLGCLVEKSFTTPDQYPITTNALTTACNQKSSRSPVVDFTSRQVSDAMLLLRQQKLARTLTGSGRTEKHKHVVDEEWSLSDQQLSLIAVLSLRGPQTAAELKSRTERYVSFESVEHVERVLASLTETPEPFVVSIGRAVGQMYERWSHLLLGEPVTTVEEAPRRSTSSSSGLTERVNQLEARLARLEAAFAASAPESAGEDLVEGSE